MDGAVPERRAQIEHDPLATEMVDQRHAARAGVRSAKGDEAARATKGPSGVTRRRECLIWRMCAKVAHQHLMDLFDFTNTLDPIIALETAHGLGSEVSHADIFPVGTSVVPESEQIES